MQTFLVSPTDFTITAQALDTRRLGKNITEAMQVYRGITGQGPRPGNPYPYLMWASYPDALILYGVAMHKEWKRRYTDNERGGKHTHKNGVEFEQLAIECGLSLVACNVTWPEWLTDEVCASHRSNLLRKAPGHYRQFWPDEPNDLPYVWPV